MSFPDSTPSTPDFRPAFVDDIVGFFGGQFYSLSQKERTHAIGVVANTLAALAINQTRSVGPESMITTLSTLSDTTNETIGNFVRDESVALLFPQSRNICEVIREAIADRDD